MPGRFPQKYRALWAGLTITASTSTGLHCEHTTQKSFNAKRKRVRIIHNTVTSTHGCKVDWRNPMSPRFDDKLSFTAAAVLNQVIGVNKRFEKVLS